MSQIVVVTGSVRPNSANSNVVPVVVSALEQRGEQVTVADMKTINLPFFDASLPPSNPEFSTSHENVQQWTEMIAGADGVVFVCPEYNHTMTPVQLNAIDWIGREWKEKPIALVGYGWSSGGSLSLATAREALGNLKATVGQMQTNLTFLVELEADGTVKDQAVVDEKLAATFDELATLVGS